MTEHEHLKSILKKELITLASSLSPGVNLKMQMQYSSSERSQESLLTVARLKKTETDSISRTRPFMKRRTLPIVKEMKKPEAWVEIYNNPKKEKYHKEWEKEVLVHSMASKQRLEYYAEKKERKLLLMELKNLKKPDQKKERSFLKIVPRNRSIVEGESEHKKEIKVITCKRVKELSQKKPPETLAPSFRQLSVDEKRGNETEQLEKTLAEKRLERTKQILLMSDTVLKIKSVTNQTLQKSENEVNVYSSLDNLDFDKIFASEDQQIEKPSFDSSSFLSGKMLELQRKIIFNSRRANTLVLKSPSETTDNIQTQEKGVRIAISIKKQEVLDQQQRFYQESATSILKESPDQANSSRSKSPQLLAHMQYESFKSEIVRKGHEKQNNRPMVPLAMKDLLNDATVKITHTHAPLSTWPTFIRRAQNSILPSG